MQPLKIIVTSQWINNGKIPRFWFRSDWKLIFGKTIRNLKIEKVTRGLKKRLRITNLKWKV